MTLRARIAAVASLSVALAVLAAAIGLYVAVRSDLRGEIDSALRSRAHALQALTASGPSRAGGGPLLQPRSPGSGQGYAQGTRGKRPDGFPRRVQPAPFGAATGYVEFVSSKGTIFVPGGQGTAPATIAVTASDRAIAVRGSGVSLDDRSVKGTKLRVLTAGNGGGGAVLIARPLTEVDHELSHLLLILVLIGAGGIVLAALLGALVARTALAPIASFTRRTESLRGNLDLSRRLEVSGRDELRTPISSLRANIQILGEADRLPPQEQESLRRDIVEELDELTALVSDVVELARGAAPEGALDDVRVDELVQGAVQSARRRGEVRFELSVEPTMVSGQADRIARAVSNLIDNARKWSPEGAAVEVTLSDGVLAVRDHGPGFSEEDLPFVFDRFYRADDARKLPGSGLGLAIVRQAAEASGGFVEAHNADGGGALLRVGFGPVIGLAGVVGLPTT